VTSQGSFTYVSIFSLLSAFSVFLTVEHINSNQSTLQYSGMWHHIVWWVDTIILEELAFSIFTHMNIRNHLQYTLWYPVLDNSESPVNWKLTKRFITFYCSINWQYPALIVKVGHWLLVLCWFRLYIQHVIQEVIKVNRKCGRKDRTGYQATNYMAVSICVVARYSKIDGTCIVLIPGKLQCLATLCCWRYWISLLVLYLSA